MCVRKPSMFFEVVSLTYGSPITIAFFTCGQAVRTHAHHHPLGLGNECGLQTFACTIARRKVVCFGQRPNVTS